MKQTKEEIVEIFRLGREKRAENLRKMYEEDAITYPGKTRKEITAIKNKIKRDESNARVKAKELERAAQRNK